MNYWFLLLMTKILFFAFWAEPPQVSISEVGYSGSGCSEGTATAVLSPDKQAMTVIFSQFVAQTGPGIAPREKRKDCRVEFELDYPQGWQYRVLTVDYRGFAALDEGSWGRQDSFYKFKGGRPRFCPPTSDYGGQCRRTTRGAMNGDCRPVTGRIVGFPRDSPSTRPSRSELPAGSKRF